MARIRRLSGSTLRGTLTLVAIEDVIRELIQNSADAGSSEIRVSIEIDRSCKSVNIECQDNGNGMSPQDLERVGSRYCTSKVKYLADIPEVRTFGFRGEALDSVIQQSSAVKIVSRASEVLFLNGKRRKHGRNQNSCGTTVTAYDVFGRVPVRKNRLFEGTQEIPLVKLRRMVFETMARCTGVELTILREITGEKVETILHTISGRECEGLTTQVSLLRQVYGKQTIPSHETFVEESRGMKVEMVIGRSPSPTRKFQFLFLNGRPLLDKCLLESARGSFSKRNFGWCDGGQKAGPVHPVFVVWVICRSEVSDLIQLQDKSCYYARRCGEINSAVDRIVEKFCGRRGGSSRKRRRAEDAAHRLPETDLSTISPFFHTISELQVQRQQLTDGSIHVIGQVDKKFVLAELNSTMIAFDQHACFERINVEKMYKETVSGTVRTKVLQEPLKITLNDEDRELFDKWDDCLKRWGFGVRLGEKTGANCSLFTIETLPTLLSSRTDIVEKAIRDYVTDLESSRKLRMDPGEHTVWWRLASQMPEMLRNCIKSAACKGSVKFGEELNYERCCEMIRELGRCHDPFHCAHGRPSLYPLCQHV